VNAIYKELYKLLDKDYEEFMTSYRAYIDTYNEAVDAHNKRLREQGQ
jgi:hypothetical protein